jgi:hypothetical protein
MEYKKLGARGPVISTVGFVHGESVPRLGYN